jgi:branched-chain amino acid transport system ATP-binding protein
MGVIRRLSHHLVVMDAGQIVADGEPESVIRDPRVIAAYLGAEADTAPGIEVFHA